MSPCRRLRFLVASIVDMTEDWAVDACTSPRRKVQGTQMAGARHPDGRCERCAGTSRKDGGRLGRPGLTGVGVDWADPAE